MVKKKFIVACLTTVFLVLFCVSSFVSAHQTVTVGPYNIEIGWLDEPPVAGQVNAIVMNLSSSDGKSIPVTEAISGLTLKMSYGGQSKVLILQPLGEDTPGQYTAPILPTIPGLYTVNVAGKLGTTAVNVEVKPEEVRGPDSVQFPLVANASTGSGPGWIGWLGLVGLGIGIIALALSTMALRKSR